MKIETALCLALTVRLLPEEPRFHVEKGPYVAWNREKLAIRAMEKGSSHLMMIDTDLVFPADGINRLSALQADIAYGQYHRKNRSYREMLADCTGFMLINLESIKNIQRPWFRAEDGVGEDVYFCRKARAAGLNVVCDERIEIGHIGEHTY